MSLLSHPSRPHSTFSLFLPVGEVRFTKDHEWVSVTAPGEATIGITDFAQSALGDVVFVDLPEVGTSFAAGDSFGSVESVKAASSVYAPVSLTVTAVNTTLQADNALINSSAEQDGWMIKVALTKPEQVDALLEKEAYEKLVKEQQH